MRSQVKVHRFKMNRMLSTRSQMSKTRDQASKVKNDRSEVKGQMSNVKSPKSRVLGLFSYTENVKILRIIS